MRSSSKVFDVVFKTALSTIGPAASAIALTILQDQLHYPLSRAVLGSILTGVVAVWLVVHLEGAIRGTAWYRKIADSRSRFEGLWIQQFLTRRDEVSTVEFSLFNVIYTAASDDYAVIGRAFDAQGNRLAHFRSDKLMIDNTFTTATYLWEEEEIWRPAGSVVPMMYGRGKLRYEVYDGNVGCTGEIAQATDTKATPFQLAPIDKKWLKDRKITGGGNLAAFLQAVAQAVSHDIAHKQQHLNAV